MNSSRLTYRLFVAIIQLLGFMAVSMNVYSVTIHTAFNENVGTGATSYALAEAGARHAFAEATASCSNPSITNCGAAGVADASTSYQVMVGASAAFYGATGLQIGSSFLIPLDVTYYIAVSGNASASVNINGNISSVSKFSSVKSKTETWNFFVSPGGGVSVTLQASASANASTNIGPYTEESAALADPIVSINPLWEYAAYSSLITIDELLDPVSSTASGVKPEGYTYLLPPSPLTPVPIPAAVWLFGSGLIGLVGVARRKK